jgi:fibronectin type 3 domain-containing protein
LVIAVALLGSCDLLTHILDPDIPQNFTASNDDPAGIRLKWDAPENSLVSVYHIERSKSQDMSNPTIIKVSGFTTYFDVALESGNIYYYRIKSQDLDENDLSGFSEIISCQALNP